MAFCLEIINNISLFKPVLYGTSHGLLRVSLSKIKSRKRDLIKAIASLEKVLQYVFW